MKTLYRSGLLGALVPLVLLILCEAIVVGAVGNPPPDPATCPPQDQERLGCEQAGAWRWGHGSGSYKFSSQDIPTPRPSAHPTPTHTPCLGDLIPGPDGFVCVTPRPSARPTEPPAGPTPTTPPVSIEYLGEVPRPCLGRACAPSHVAGTERVLQPNQTHVWTYTLAAPVRTLTVHFADRTGPSQCLAVTFAAVGPDRIEKIAQDGEANYTFRWFDALKGTYTLRVTDRQPAGNCTRRYFLGVG